jgi:hypothetical protein
MVVADNRGTGKLNTPEPMSLEVVAVRSTNGMNRAVVMMGAAMASE